MNFGTVIVGAGQSGLNVAVRLRALGYDKPIALVGEELQPPYQRPPLSKKFMSGSVDMSSLLLRPMDFYKEQSIELLLGVRGALLDTARRRLTLSDDRELGYEHLVLATGTRAREWPEAAGGHLSGVHVLRSMEHAQALQRRLVPGQTLVVVGGGFIGLEVAATARQAGMNVTVLEQAPRILQRVAGPEVSQRLRALHEANGVRVLEHQETRAIRGHAGAVRELELGGGQVLSADLVLVGIGAVPNTELASAAGLDVQDGILVDRFGQTRAPGVYACGDCARFPWNGSTLRLESVHNAMAQSDGVAQSILQRAVPYVPVPWFWSDQYGCKLQMVGISTGHDRVVVRDTGATATQGASFWYFRTGRLLAVEALNDMAAFAQARRWLEQNNSPDPDELAQPSVALKDLTLRESAAHFGTHDDVLPQL